MDMELSTGDDHDRLDADLDPAISIFPGRWPHPSNSPPRSPMDGGRLSPVSPQSTTGMFSSSTSTNSSCTFKYPTPPLDPPQYISPSGSNSGLTDEDSVNPSAFSSSSFSSSSSSSSKVIVPQQNQSRRQRNGSGREIIKRKSHRKSKTGCITCRTRRVKCDEKLPICNNCSKHKVRCDYADLKPDQLHDLHLAQLVDRAINYFVLRSNVLSRPFASIRPFPTLSETDMKLLQHISLVSTRFILARPEHTLIWKEVAVQSAQTEPFILHAFLALASAHLAFLFNSAELFRYSLEHKNAALCGTQIALTQFSKYNSENVLAASLLLCWQSFYTEDLDPSGGAMFASLSFGVETVLEVMNPWRHEFPLASQYYHTLESIEFPPLFDVEDYGSRMTVFKLLRTSILILEPLCGRSKPASRRYCINALLTNLNCLMDLVEGGEFDRLSYLEQKEAVKSFTRWQTCFVPMEMSDDAPILGYIINDSTPISESLVKDYGNDSVVRLIFAYFYSVNLLVIAFWPQLRPCRSFIPILGSIESIMWGLKQHRDWWSSIRDETAFILRLIDCFKISSWEPIMNMTMPFDLPDRVNEILWYGLTESVSLNTIKS
ncbi:uncharacterized protein V1516DRAFT_670158 [Lipomyces oligophaga]|uniref:uncharacterized protein n=1 Tax=Lipomyces oligophaga TaxID=45792 RepID=UPI0034CEBEE5